MTFNEVMKKMLVERGMFPQQADQVLALSKGHVLLDDMEGRMDEQTDRYPASVLAATWTALRTIALDWIEDRQPDFRFKYMFMDE